MVRRNPYSKHCTRKIRETFSRYISILLLVMLGVAFFMGMNSISPDMKATAQKHLEATKAYDIQILSKLGFTRE